MTYKQHKHPRNTSAQEERRKAFWKAVASKQGIHIRF